MQTQWHYHIHWTGKTLVDWEPFATAEDAKSCADRLVLNGESYSIEKFDDDCARCRKFTEEKKIWTGQCRTENTGSNSTELD